MVSIAGQFEAAGAPLEVKRLRSVASRNHSRVNLHEASGENFAGLSTEGRSARNKGITILLDGALHEDDAVKGGARKGPGNNDAALIACAWRQWGEDSPNRLLGDYAFAVHDTAQRRVHLVRDHIGTRPLYWNWQDGRLTFATFLPDLLALLPKLPVPDEETVAAFLRWPIALGSRTFLAGIRAVEPGCLVTCDADGVTARRWWHPGRVPDTRFRDAESYASAFSDLVERSVRDRIGGAKRVGSHLSGGIDSTLVTLVAQEALQETGQRLNAAYSWSPPVSPANREMAMDERLRIEEICARAGLHPRFSTKSGADERAFLSRSYEHEGLADVYDELAILGLAEADGTDVLLSGWGGDEVVSAHAHSVPASLLRRGRPIRALSLVRTANRGFRPLSTTLRLIWRNVLLPLMPDLIYDRAPFFSDLFGEGCYISTALAKRISPSEPYGRYRISGVPAADMAAHLMQGHLAERMATWAAWAAPYGIEYRYPLTDRRLHEFVLGVPPEILWGDGRPRYLARTALSGRAAGLVGKLDPANERQRMRAARECWNLLAREVAAGAFDGACDWLDMSSLRRDLSRGPSGNDETDALSLIRLFPAVRVWCLAERFGLIGEAGWAST